VRGDDLNFNQLLIACDPIEVTGSPEGELNGHVVHDSRRVMAGDVFVAIRGNQTDGHRFIGDALKKGASVVIAEEPAPAGHNFDTAIWLHVKDSRKVLLPLSLAMAGDPQDNLVLIGITGTNGKTTVSTLVYQVLTRLGYNASLMGTVARKIGKEELPSRLTTPDPLEIAADLATMYEAGSTHLVMEVSSHALDQHRVNGLRFEVAGFTNLTHDHLDYHGSLENYLSAKKSLFDHLDPRSIAVINEDDPSSNEIIADTEATVWKMSFKEGADFRILSNTPGGLELDLDGIYVESPLIGVFNAYNVGMAYLVCLALGCSKTNVASALAEAKGAAGRMEKVQVYSSVALATVIVDYAHTPDALENVLKTLSEIREKHHNIHVVFGCGGDRDKAKRPVMGKLAEEYGDLVTVTSDNPRNEEPGAIIDDILKGLKKPGSAIVESNRRLAIEQTVERSDENTIIVILGKGHETYQEIRGERYEMDDRMIARGALLNKSLRIKNAGELN
jgi:UDP-N-acetylmuramoyl-L-alanyl-D-glutamate--2,6-diaminopimelate ligase